MNNKLYSIDELAPIVRSIKETGKKVVHCHGVFDLLHIGHIKYLQAAKQLGDVLIVTLTPDRFVNKGPSRPAFPEVLRGESLMALDIVDFVGLNNWPTAIETIKQLKPDIYVKGPDYKQAKNDLTGNINLEADAVRSVGGDIEFTDTPTSSSSELINQYLPVFNPEQQVYLGRIKAKYTGAEIFSYFEQMTNLKVLLVGEIILDEYVYCTALGKSGKEPIIATQKISQEMYAGGVLAVANHVSGFTKKAKLFSYLGENGSYSNFIKNHIKDNVGLDCIRKSGSPTIVKRRYVDAYSNTKQFGVYEINDELISEREEAEFCRRLEKALPHYDVVIVTDYGHGLVTPKVVDLLTEKAKFLAVNTQSNAANVGYYTIPRYRRSDFVSIHEGELRQEYRSRTRDIRELAQTLQSELNCKNVIITRGSHGSLSFANGDGFIECPAFANKVVDRIGAGDTLLSMAALCCAVNMPMDLTLLLGNLAGAHAVATIGNKTALSKTQMLKTLTTCLK
ncbi:MAG: PfkB family carbohydrate kinase [Candidatus Neomarinimicrobiota bacterium]